MAHIRTTLRGTLRTRLEGTASGTSTNIFDSLVQAREAQVMPVFAYWIEQEPVTPHSKGGGTATTREYRRESRCLLYALARDITTLDGLTEEIEVAMAPALGIMTVLTDTSFFENDDSERYYVGTRLAYSVNYRTNAVTPSASSDPLTP